MTPVGRYLKRLATVVCSTLLLPFIVLFIPIFLMCGLVQGFTLQRVRVMMLRRRMKKLERASDWSFVEGLPSCVHGSIIVDWPSMGWDDCDAWWTSEQVSEVAEKSGIPRPLMEFLSHRNSEFVNHPDQLLFEEWCRKRYVDDRSGIAILVHSSGSKSLHAKIERLRLTHAKIEVVQASVSAAEVAKYLNRPETDVDQVVG